MYSRGVKTSFLFLPKREVELNDPNLRRDLTVVSRFGGQEVKLFSERGEWFGVPLYHSNGIEVASLKDGRISSKVSFKFMGELRREQALVVDRIKRELERGKTGFLIEAKPGFGKTTVAIAVLSILGERALVVVPRSNLIRQWKDRLKQFSSLKDNDIGWVEGGRGDWEGKTVVVGLVHSLALNRYGEGFRKAFGCVVFDEVDRSVPPATFAPVVTMFPSKFRIGMSATFKRQDGLEVIFQKHIGEVHVKGGDEGRMTPTILIHYYPKTSGFVYPGSSKMNRRGMILSRLARNRDRTIEVAKYIHLIWKSGRKCLVLSDRKSLLDGLYEVLKTLFTVPPKDMGFYIRTFSNGRPMTDLERRRTASNCKIILGTFSMIQMGTDIPDLAGLVYATPQSEVQQSQGRIERFLDGKKKPVVVDFVDTAYTDCLGWGIKRKRWYHQQGLEVKVI